MYVCMYVYFYITVKEWSNIFYYNLEDTTSYINTTKWGFNMKKKKNESFDVGKWFDYK